MNTQQRKHRQAGPAWVLAGITGLLAACGGGGGSSGTSSEPGQVHTLEDIAIQASLLPHQALEASRESIFIFLSPFLDRPYPQPYDCTEGGNRTLQSIQFESVYQPGVTLSGERGFYDHCAPTADDELNGRYEVVDHDPGFISAGESPDKPLTLDDEHGTLQRYGRAEQCGDCTEVNGLVTHEMRLRMDTTMVEEGERFVLRFGQDEQPFVLRWKHDAPGSGQSTLWMDGLLELQFNDCLIGPARLRVRDEAKALVRASGGFSSGELEMTAGDTVATVHFSPGEITVVSAGDSQTFTSEQLRIEALNRCPELPF